MGQANLFPGFVPCLRALLSVGVHEGGRNKTAFQLGVFLQKSRPNDWKSQLEEHKCKAFFSTPSCRRNRDHTTDVREKRVSVYM